MQIEKIADTVSKLEDVKRKFEENIQDDFGRSIVNSFFIPTLKNIKSLEEAIQTADGEERAVKEMLQKARAVI